MDGYQEEKFLQEVTRSTISLFSVLTPVRFCHFSPNTECEKMEGKGVSL